jgi:hypothetical protein
VTNAVVQSFFEHQYDPWGNKPNIVKQKKVQVNEKGEATLEGKDLKGGVGGSAFAEGYYATQAGQASKRKNMALNRWEPWNPTINVKMRPKKNPVPMVYEWINRENFPAVNQPVAFDLEKKDWVAPHGKGIIADIVFTPIEKGEPGIECTITFSNPKDGIQEYIPEAGLRSSYIFPYEAPQTGYKESLFKEMWYENNLPPQHTNVKPDDQINYIFRVRTVVDEDGNIVSANYGRIQGDIRVIADGSVWFKYWFNPNPQSRSLESDRKPY